MEGHHHHHHHPPPPPPHPQQHHQIQQPISTVSSDADRFPQWSLQETKEFLMIRAELDQNFMETKRNKLLWEVISNKMREKGFNRSAEQCKCKWKNLVTRYKGCETMEAEAMRQQFPFYNELQSIFSARNMQSMLWSESEGGGGVSGSKKKAVHYLSSDEEEQDIQEESEQLDKSSSIRKKKKGKTTSTGFGTSSSGNNTNSIKEMLEDFMRQQLQMEMQWREAFEARENERRLKEMEWRQTMEALENERLMMERRWREREEERRMREEARAEKRDALITALLNKLRREDRM